jgi:hypothetical protein
MPNKGTWLWISGIILVCVFAYIAGRHHTDPTVKWYSDMTSQIQGRKIYLIDTPVTCPDHTFMGQDGKPQLAKGKPLGEIKVDVNLQSGELKVVKNTVPAWFDCK